MRYMAGATTLGDLASAMGMAAKESSVITELKAGSEEAYAWLIAQYQQPIYSLVYRIVRDPSDAADTTQEVFLKVYRGMKHFNGSSTLKTWMYRIAVHEASNRRRWWFRHKARETPLEPGWGQEEAVAARLGPKDTVADEGPSPFHNAAQEELKARVEKELRQVAEPYRTTVVLRDIEEFSYEEIAEIMEVSLGTVKSRLTRGREALKKRLVRHLPELGLEYRPASRETGFGSAVRGITNSGQEVEVAS
jgi:RNA polymerase sigma-70 factor (ECF subfamily)